MSTDEILSRLVKARNQAGLSQSQVAKQMNFASTSTISHYESGARGLSFENFLKLCELYGVSTTWAITGKSANFDPTPLLRNSRVAAGDARRLADLLESLASDDKE